MPLGIVFALFFVLLQLFIYIQSLSHSVRLRIWIVGYSLPFIDVCVVTFLLVLLCMPLFVVWFRRITMRHIIFCISVIVMLITVNFLILHVWAIESYIPPTLITIQDLACNAHFYGYSVYADYAVLMGPLFIPFAIFGLTSLIMRRMKQS